MKLITFVAILGLTSAPAWAKGLQTLSTQNPEAKEGEGSEGAASESGGGAEEAGSSGEVKGEKKASGLSKTLDKKLFFGTSFGWVLAKKSGAELNGGGMSDFTAGYKIMSMNKQLSVYGTYRYAPVAVSGKIETHSYRGIWESHLFGARACYEVNGSLTAFGTGELGPTVVHMTATDGLPKRDEDDANGFQLALGGGANWDIDDKGAFTIGPRLSAGFGSYTTIQIAGGVGFLF